MVTGVLFDGLTQNLHRTLSSRARLLDNFLAFTIYRKRIWSVIPDDVSENVPSALWIPHELPVGVYSGTFNPMNSSSTHPHRRRLFLCRRRPALSSEAGFGVTGCAVVFCLLLLFIRMSADTLYMPCFCTIQRMFSAWFPTGTAGARVWKRGVLNCPRLTLQDQQASGVWAECVWEECVWEECVWTFSTLSTPQDRQSTARTNDASHLRPGYVLSDQSILWDSLFLHILSNPYVSWRLNSVLKFYRISLWVLQTDLLFL